MTTKSRRGFPLSRRNVVVILFVVFLLAVSFLLSRTPLLRASTTTESQLTTPTVHIAITAEGFVPDVVTIA